MIFKIEKLAKEIGVFEQDLITRVVGKDLYNKVSEKLDIIQEDELLIIDFDLIKVVDSSFIDEFFIKILEKAFNEKNFFIKLKNINKILESNIDIVMQSYSKYNRNRVLITTDNICSNNNFYIGKLNKNEKNIFEYIRINKNAKFDDLLKLIDSQIEDHEESIKSNLNSLIEMKMIRVVDNKIYSSL